MALRWDEVALGDMLYRGTKEDKKIIMKFNYKKISAVLTSGLMVLSGVGFAAAANFPAPFSDGKAADTGIVVGASADPLTDGVAQANINTYLAGKVQSEGGAPVGENFKIEKPSTKLDIAKGVTDVWGTTVTSSDLPTLLADGVYKNANNDEYKYTQQINLGNLTFSHFHDVDYNDNKPDLGFSVTSNTMVSNYTVTFTTQPQATQPGTSGRLTDLENRNIRLLGKNYYILKFYNNTATGITLLDSAVSDSLTLSETKTVVIDGKNYDVTLTYLDASNAKFTIKMPDGTLVTTDPLTNTANTYNLGNGIYLGVRNILFQGISGGAGSVDFSLGKGKLEIKHGTNVKINDKTINDLYGYISMSNGAKQGWQSVILTWTTSDKAFLTQGKELVMPGFEAIKFSMSDTTMPKKDVTQVVTGSTYAQLKTSIKNGDVTIPFLYITEASGGLAGIGKDATTRLATSNSTNLGYNRTIQNANYHNAFVASWAASNAKDSETHYLRFGQITTNSDAGRNETSIDEYQNGAWTTVKDVVYAGQSYNFGSVTLTINLVSSNATDKAVYLSINSGGSFHDIYTKDGLHIYLPVVNNVNALTNSGKGVLNSTNLTAGNEMTPFTLWFNEQDQYGTLDKAAFNVTIDGTGGTSSSHETTVSAIDANGQSEIETDSQSKIYQAYMNTPLATKVTWDKTDTNYYSANVEYHLGEVYANVFVTAPTATMGTVGNMVFKDSEKASWQTRNVVVVGGSCINSAAAEVLKLTYPACESAFTDATNVAAGQFMVAGYADAFTTGKLALVVAGYNGADTLAGAQNLLDNPAKYDTSKKYIGTVASGSGSVDVVAA